MRPDRFPSRPGTNAANLHTVHRSAAERAWRACSRPQYGLPSGDCEIARIAGVSVRQVDPPDTPLDTAPDTAQGTQRRRRTLVAAECACYLAAIALLGISGIALLSGEVRATQARQALPDMQLWSPSRKAAYFDAADRGESTLLASLHIPAVDLSVPVYDSASELNLDRGAGVIDGMAYPHEGGHIGIAGHRDGYFRALKDLHIGDTLELETLHGRKHFVIDDLRIIEADELHYLGDTTDQRLTIVTCYPFYFAGSAPQRFLVRASMSENDPDGSPAKPRSTNP